MDHATTEIRTEQWRQIVLEANGSSLTKKEFCRQNGIKEKQFYYWQRKIRRQESSRLRLEATLAPVESTSVVSSCSSSSFVTVNLSEPEDTSSLPLSLSSTFHPELMIQINASISDPGSSQCLGMEKAALKKSSSGQEERTCAAELTVWFRSFAWNTEWIHWKKERYSFFAVESVLLSRELYSMGMDLSCSPKGCPTVCINGQEAPMRQCPCPWKSSND